MQFVYTAVALLAVLLAFPLFFTSSILSRTLGIFTVIAAVVAMLLIMPQTSSALQDAYDVASRAVK